MQFNLTVLPGDGIGPEVTNEAIKALEAVEPEYMQEKSNIADMRFLQNAFVIPPEMFDNVAMAAMRDELIRFDSESA